MRVESMLPALVIVTSFGCYNPTVSAGAPCDPATARCPLGQMCVAEAGGYFCSTGSGSDGNDAKMADARVIPVDGRPDASGSGDSDQDGVIDSVDNCPNKANANQANEDNDAYGDACDPCPPFADGATPLDADGDGVADACDPNPITPGDAIVKFEGFASGIPTTWSTMGAVSASAGDAVLTAAGSSTILGFAEPSVVHDYIWSGVTFTSGGGGSPIFAVILHREPGTDNDISCQLVGGGAPKVRLYAAGSAGGNSINDGDHAEVVGQQYVLKLGRDAADYDCATTNPNGVTSGTNSYSPGSPEAGLRVRDATANYHWVMVLTAP